MRQGRGMRLGKEQLGELCVQRRPEKILVLSRLLAFSLGLTSLWEWPGSVLAVYKWYESGLFLSAINTKLGCGRSELCHCDQNIVNNLTEQGFQSVQSLLLAPLLLGLW